MNKVSVVMATYNGAKFIREQLNSFIVQSRKPDELIVVDDCSTDNTLDIVEEFKNTSPFDVIIVPNKENIGSKRKYGYAHNFEKALNICTGDIIFFSDQDDVWFPQKISYHLEIYSKYKDIQMIANNAIRTNSNLAHYGLTQIDYAKISWNSFKVCIGCCYSIRKTFLKFLLPIPSFTAHDIWIDNFMSVLGLRYNIDQSLQYFRRSPEAWSVINENSNAVTVLQCYFI